MTIKVLQGINLENSITTILIELKEPTPSEILDKIQSFHPLFMNGYSFEGNTLKVQSKLPHLWVEIGKALQKLSNRDWSIDYATKYIHEEVIKKQISSMSTIPILQSAANQGLEITQMFLNDAISPTSALNRRYIIGCGAESHQICSFSSSKDSTIGFFTQRDKTLTNSILDRLGVPSPKWAEITNREDIDKLWDEFNKPVVIKPAGLMGGSGVVTKITNKEQAYKAFEDGIKIVNLKQRSKYQYKILMQEQVEGEDYRLLVINNKFQIATKRVPAHVIGDGLKTVKELIEETNKDPRRDISNPTHTLKPIVIDDSLTDFLKDQSLSLEYIPKRNERVYVRKIASMSKGGTTEDFTDQVHPQIKRIVESLATSIHAYSLGIDLFCKDISKPLTPENGAILECNNMPEAYLNAFPVVGKQFSDIGDIFLEGLIGKNRTKRVVVLGGSTKEMFSKLSLELNTTSETLGVYSNEKMYINEDLFNEKIDAHEAFESLKINGSLTTIVHHLSKEELKVQGSGFDQIDLFINLKSDSEVQKAIGGYKNIGLIYNTK